MSDQKKIIRTPPSLKYVSGAPGEKIKQLTMEIERLSAKNNSFQAEVFSIDLSRQTKICSTLPDFPMLAFWKVFFGT